MLTRVMETAGQDLLGGGGLHSWRGGGRAARQAGPRVRGPPGTRSQGSPPKWPEARPGEGRGVLLLRLVGREQRGPPAVLRWEARHHQGRELQEPAGGERYAGAWERAVRAQGAPHEAGDHLQRQQGPVGQALERADWHGDHDPGGPRRPQGGRHHRGLPPAEWGQARFRGGGPHREDMGSEAVRGPPRQVIQLGGPPLDVPDGLHADPRFLHESPRPLRRLRVLVRGPAAHEEHAGEHHPVEARVRRRRDLRRGPAPEDLQDRRHQHLLREVQRDGGGQQVPAGPRELPRQGVHLGHRGQKRQPQGDRAAQRGDEAAGSVQARQEDRLLLRGQVPGLRHRQPRVRVEISLNTPKTKFLETTTRLCNLQCKRRKPYRCPQILACLPKETPAS
mmetsp:Transcript_14319/g.40706  ORF Transcript_14319/g.40706 Transcript_14319/m.40706 type:complete len:392 (-) Transcript_14319:131-1306(-)